MANFNFRVNVEEVAAKLNQTADVVQNKIAGAVETLVASTHAFVVNKAQTELGDYKRSIFPGPPGEDGQPKNVKWKKIADRIWVVEIMPEAAWIEEGRPQTSMATEQWLLKPGAKGVKTAKDGSTYRVIPFTHTQGTGKDKPATGTSEYSKPALAAMAKTAIKAAGINLKRIERHADGSPKLGVLHKIDVPDPGRENAGFHSKPRGPEDAKKTGFKEHGGHFHLSGLVVTQRINAKGKVTREATTFRVVSSKHRLEGRWEYPAVPAFNSLPAAVKYAEEEWSKMVQAMEQEFNR